MIHNAEVQQVEAEEVSADEMWSFVQKNNQTARTKNINICCNFRY